MRSRSSPQPFLFPSPIDVLRAVPASPALGGAATAVGDAFWDWFGGFVDGEGNLSISGHGGNLQPRFRLNQRDDDADLVREIAARLGLGTIHARIDNTNPNAKPQVVLAVQGAHCVRLVAIFDRHPLRSKKRLEYPLWREAVCLYASMIGGRWKDAAITHARTQALAPLRDALMAVRRYRGPR